MVIFPPGGKIYKYTGFIIFHSLDAKIKESVNKLYTIIYVHYFLLEVMKIAMCSCLSFYYNKKKIKNTSYCKRLSFMDV